MGQRVVLPGSASSGRIQEAGTEVRGPFHHPESHQPDGGEAATPKDYRDKSPPHLPRETGPRESPGTSLPASPRRWERGIQHPTRDPLPPAGERPAIPGGLGGLRA